MAAFHVRREKAALFQWVQGCVKLITTHLT
jgi:hypothetical protein